MASTILVMKDITKTFVGVKALSNINFSVTEGEIHGIVGENGAGKSTLMNILSGVYPYGTYSGEIFYNGEKCRLSGIKDSEKKGIVIIHQEFALVPYMSIAENMFLGNECKTRGLIDWNKTQKLAQEHLQKVGVVDDALTLVKDIGIGKQQMVEIAKALAKKVKLLILDEPTAALNVQDSEKLLNLLLDLKEQGVTSILISHKLEEICKVADKITIIRDGVAIETLDNTNRDCSEPRIIKGMVGREMTERFPRRNAEIGDVAFEVKNFSSYHPVFGEIKVVDDVNINVRKGEIVGMYGLMGAGRTEFAMGVFGKSYGSRISGKILRDGRELRINNVSDAIKNRIAYIPEDRKENGLVLINNVKMNISLAGLPKLSKRSVVDEDSEVRVAEDFCDKVGIRTTGINQIVERLSGGNQQKVVFSKWIFTKPDLLILDEPTRGVDVGAKFEIYSIINDLAKQGTAVLFISSDLVEILGMADRLYIMNEGSIVDEMAVAQATQEKIMQSTVGKRR